MKLSWRPHASPHRDMTMRTRILVLSALLVLHSKHARAQQVVMHSVDPTAIVQALSAQLEPQGYTLATSDTKKAVFTRATPAYGAIERAMDQLTFRFKQTSDGVVVAVSEEIVSFFKGGQGHMSVDSHRDPLQQLLDNARAQLESERPAPDSAGKHDSTSVNQPGAGGEPSSHANVAGLDSLIRAGMQNAFRSNLEDPALLSALVHRLVELVEVGGTTRFAAYCLSIGAKPPGDSVSDPSTALLELLNDLPVPVRPRSACRVPPAAERKAVIDTATGGAAVLLSVVALTMHQPTAYTAEVQWNFGPFRGAGWSCEMTKSDGQWRVPRCRMVWVS